MLAYTRPMSADDSILAAYVFTALLVGGMCVTTWMRARRVKRSLATQERSTRK